MLTEKFEREEHILIIMKNALLRPPEPECKFIHQCSLSICLNGYLGTNVLPLKKP